MTDTNPTPPMKANLGIGTILGGTFSLYFKNFPLFFGVVFLPFVLYSLLVEAPMRSEMVVDPANPFGDVGTTLLLMVLSMLLIIILQAVIVRMSISLSGGQGAQAGAAIRGAVTGLIPIILAAYRARPLCHGPVVCLCPGHRFRECRIFCIGTQ